MPASETSIPLKLFDDSVLYGRYIAVDGRLGSMSRRDFRSLVDSKGGTMVDLTSPQVDLIVVGAESEHSPLPIQKSSISRIEETRLWESLGFVEPENETGRLYTPAMLAELLGVPVSTIRRWHRRELIRPVRQFKKLPYFDFEEVASAQRIARLIAAGNSAESIEMQLSEIAKAETHNQRTLSQLSVIVKGKEVLLRQGDGLIEPGGQQVLPFDSFATVADDSPEVYPIEMALPLTGDNESFLLGHGDGAGEHSRDDLIELAIELEDEGDLANAIDCYRSILMANGPSADISFRIAELLYQMGELAAARERYFNAIEQEPSYVEARASLGCILMELGESEMAISCFQGALDQHPDYPDVHFHLAKLLEESGKIDQAIDHWEAFLQLAPKSPWAEEARSRLAAKRN